MYVVRIVESHDVRIRGCDIAGGDRDPGHLGYSSSRRFGVSTDADEDDVPGERLSGTKVGRGIPMNIHVVTSDFIQDIGAFNQQEAMADNASVSVSDNSYQATVRGFTSSWQLRNGFRSYKRTDASEVARIETISGPAGVRYGITQPGGIRNIITRQPTGKNSGLISESHASTDSELREGDFNVRLNDQMSRLLIGACEQDIPEADYVVNRFKLFSPAFAWQFDRNTKLTVNAGWTVCAHPFARGILAYNTYNRVPIQSPVSEGGFGGQNAAIVFRAIWAQARSAPAGPARGLHAPPDSFSRLHEDGQREGVAESAREQAGQAAGFPVPRDEIRYLANAGRSYMI